MNIRIILTTLLISAAIVGVNNPTFAQHKTASSEQGAIQEIHRLVNEHRIKKGLKPLEMNDDINKEALKHSKNMASGRVGFGHGGFKDRSNKLMNAIKGANASGENVEYTTGNAAEVVDNWLHSPNHKKNIEGNFTLTGIGMARASDGQVYYTQIFIKN